MSHTPHTPARMSEGLATTLKLAGEALTEAEQRWKAERQGRDEDGAHRFRAPTLYVQPSYVTLTFPLTAEYASWEDLQFVLGIAEQHGGTASVRAKSARGTTEADVALVVEWTVLDNEPF